MLTQPKNRLLLSTALTLTIGLCCAGVQAADLTMTGNAGFASAGGADSSNVENAAAGDNVNLNGNDLDINIIATTDDGTANGTLDIGAITGTGTVNIGTGGLGSPTTEDTNAVITSITGATTLNISNTDGDDAAISATFTEGVSLTDDLVIQNNETTSAETVQMTVNGNLTVGNVTTITGGSGGEATGLILLGNNNTFTGAVTVTGGAGDEAVLVLTGETTSFDAGLTLTNGAGGVALLEVNGSTAQVISGDISGTGDVSVSNIAEDGAIFEGDVSVGSITVNADSSDQLVLFEGDVTTTGAIDLGDNSGADTIILAFGDSGTTTIAATGGINDGGSETAIVAAQGGGTIIMNSAIDVDEVVVQGNTVFEVNQALDTASGTTIAFGSTFNAGNGAIGSDFTNAGSLNINGSGDITGAVENNGFLVFDAASTGVIIGNVTGTGSMSVDGSSAQVQGNVTQATADIAGSLAVTGDYTVNTTTFEAGSATLSLSANGDITGDLLADSQGDGRLIIENAAGSTTLDGHVGSASAAFGEIILGGNSGTAQLTLLGDLHVASSVDIGASDELIFEGSTQTVTGILEGNSDNQGRVIIGDAANATTVNFNGTLGSAATTLNEVLISDLSTLAIDAGSGDITTLTVDGTLDVGQDVQLDVNTLAGTNGTINMTVGKDSGGVDNSAAIISGTLLTADANAETVNGLTTTISVGTGNLADGDALLIYTSTGAVGGIGDADTDIVAAEDSSAVFDFEIVRGDNSTVTGGNTTELYAIASRNAVSSITSDSNGQNALTVLFDLGGAGGNMDDVIANVNNASSGDIDDVLSSVTSTVDGGNVVGATIVSNGSADLISFELASLRDNEFGIATGDDLIYRGLRPWIQVFGQTAEQDERDGFQGFDLDSVGITAGIDTQDLVDDTVLGMAFTYASTEVDSNNATRTQTDIDTYQLSGYFNHNMSDTTYMAGQMSYGFSQNDTIRNNVGGVGGLTARGEFDSHQYNLRGEVGHHIALQDSVIFTPKFTASYLHYAADDYTETGAGNAGLRVENEALNMLELGVGADLSWRYETGTGGVLKPKISAGIRYDTLGEKVETTNQFIAGGNAFQTEGFDPAQTTYDIGLSIEYKTADEISILGEYDYELKEDYDSHAAALKAMFKF